MLTQEELTEVYDWVDEFPLSRPKRNIARDFSDAVMVAEILNIYLPNIVELHNYPPVNSIRKKRYNWETLKKKILKKIGISLKSTEIEDLVSCKNDAIEKFLLRLKDKLEEIGIQKGGEREPAEATDFKNLAPTRYQINVSTPGEGPSPLKKPKRVKPKEKFSVVDPEEARKSEVIAELKETVEILESKINKMEMLVRLKDDKINMMQQKIGEMEGAIRGNPQHGKY